MDYPSNSNAKLRALDQIEEQVHQVMTSATSALSEFSKDKPSIKSVEAHVIPFLKSLETVESSVHKQIQYLSQASTLQPHEGSSYGSVKEVQMAKLRIDHILSSVNELENLKTQHQLQFQKHMNIKKERIEQERNQAEETAMN